mmetsp:Transcript_46587/g.96956  ORF Transcript_46587/g.96956 Transcript_46587/m.96956 type:complete len:207 (+) Transcript_46587:12-632(+)
MHQAQFACMLCPKLQPGIASFCGCTHSFRGRMGNRSRQLRCGASASEHMPMVRAVEHCSHFIIEVPTTLVQVCFLGLDLGTYDRETVHSGVNVASLVQHPGRNKNLSLLLLRNSAFQKQRLTDTNRFAELAVHLHRRTAPGPSAGRQEGEVAQDVVHGGSHSSTVADPSVALGPAAKLHRALQDLLLWAIEVARYVHCAVRTVNEV